MDYGSSRGGALLRGLSLVCSVGVLFVIFSSAAAEPFQCNSSGTCDALVDYVLPNSTTLSRVQTLFNVKNLTSILGANNLPLSTPPQRTFPANQTLKIPFPCICTKGATGKSNKLPIYTVVPNDFLYHIAAEVFSGLVTSQQIQAVNNISNANLIYAGQKLWIPLPCSCDQVDGQMVVHYGYAVPARSSVDGIAQQYNTTADVLLRLNGLASPNDLKAGAILDVPLKACASMVSNTSLDYPLLVPNGTYTLTATNCVKCNCDAANNWTLNCEPSQIKSSVWSSCPSMQCQGTDNLYLGNTTSSSCSRSTCAYAGYYNNRTISTTTALDSTCPASNNNSSAMSMQGSWKRNLWLFVLVQVLVLCVWI
ncbi:unnamed protein product [Coffea canephora]|uniref:LysM domain-containing protein n=1 Tax=Coffea canephora TaxID=49390 RepID=A0A068V1H5_COFCA|nr:unnamed protein product [Coffea canephora]